MSLLNLYRLNRLYVTPWVITHGCHYLPGRLNCVRLGSGRPFLGGLVGLWHGPVILGALPRFLA